MPPQFSAVLWTARAPRFSLKRAALVALTGASLIPTVMPRALACDLPFQPVVNGHHVEPREIQLLSIGHPDVTPAEAGKIDQLYSELMRSAARVTTQASMELGLPTAFRLTINPDRALRHE